MKSPVLVSLLLVSAAFPAAAVSAAHLPSARQVADLKSFFHGEPAQPPKAPPPKVTATVAFAAGVTPDPQVEDFFRAFAAAVKARDGASMLPRLSDRYTIADLPEDHKASDFFVMGIERIPGPEAITLQSVEWKDTVRTVKAEIRYAAKTAVKTFRFDAAGKLIASDLFVLKRVEHGT
jgi:hypothetical protein